MEKAKQLNPAIGLAEMAVRYAEEAEAIEDESEKDLKNWQSMILVHDYIMLMKARMNPQPPEEEGGKRKEGEERADMTGLSSLGKLLGAGGLLGGGQANNVTQRAQEVGNERQVV